MPRPSILLHVAALVSLAACGASSHSGTGPAGPPAPPGFVNGPSGPIRVDDGGAPAAAAAAASAMPIIFVHGLAADRHVWDDALAHERATRRALAFDLHGMGESAPSARNDYSIDSFAADLAAVVDGVQPPLPARFVLVGHSLGGTVVTAYAAAHPERVAGIVYVDAPPDMTSIPPATVQQFEAGVAPASVERFSAALFDGMLESAQPATKQRVLASLHATPPAVISGAFVAMLHYDPKPALARYAGLRLALVTRGNDEPISIHHLVSGIEHQMVDGVSHWLMMDKPTEFAATLDGFLAHAGTTTK